MNSGLCKEFSDVEIGDALFQMSPFKVLGPDWFSTRFFPKNWETMKNDVIRGVKSFFDTGKMLQEVNETTIVLIPKKRCIGIPEGLHADFLV
jgi:hypothetical protein